MSEIGNKDKGLVKAGVLKLWYLDMAEVTSLPCNYRSELILSDNVILSGGSKMYPVNTEFDSLIYTEALNSKGADNYLLSIGGRLKSGIRASDQVLMQKLRVKDLLILFKTTEGVYRLVISARLKFDSNTDSVTGKPTANASFTRKSNMPAWFYEGAHTINSDGTLVFT